MSPSTMARIQQLLLLRRVDLSHHAVQEAFADGLGPADVRSSLATGYVSAVFQGDPRGARYEIVGKAADGRTDVGSVGRFTEDDRYLVVTVYKLN